MSDRSLLIHDSDIPEVLMLFTSLILSDPTYIDLIPVVLLSTDLEVDPLLSTLHLHSFYLQILLEYSEHGSVEASFEEMLIHSSIVPL